MKNSSRKQFMDAINNKAEFIVKTKKADIILMLYNIAALPMGPCKVPMEDFINTAIRYGGIKFAESVTGTYMIWPTITNDDIVLEYISPVDELVKIAKPEPAPAKQTVKEYVDDNVIFLVECTKPLSEITDEHLKEFDKLRVDTVPGKVNKIFKCKTTHTLLYTADAKKYSLQYPYVNLACTPKQIAWLLSKGYKLWEDTE